MNSRKIRLLCVFLPLFAALLYLALCFLNFDSSLWFDESYTAYLISGDFGDIWNLTAQDVHPPLFYFALKIWSMIFGSADFALRAFSLTFGAISIILLFHLVRYKTKNIPLSTLSTFALAICPMFVRYGEEARMYTFVFFLILVTTFVFFVILDQEKPKWWLYVIFAILVALGMYTHYFAIFAYFVFVAYLIYRKRFNRRWLFAFLGAILLYVPWLPSLKYQVSTLSAGYWIDPVSLATFPNYLAEALVYKEYAVDVNGWLVLPIIGALVLAVYAFLKKPRPTFLIFAALLPPALLFLFSLPPLNSMFSPRYVLYAVVALWVLFAFAIYRFWSGAFAESRTIFKRIREHFCVTKKKSTKPLAFALAGLVVIISIFGMINVRERPLESTMKELIATIHRSGSPAPILTNSPWLYYDAYAYTTEDYPVHFVHDWTAYEYGSLAPLQFYHYNVDPSFESFLVENENFWFIYDAPGNNSDPTTAAVSESEALPRKELEAYRPLNTISTEQYIAVEFTKE